MAEGEVEGQGTPAETGAEKPETVVVETTGSTAESGTVESVEVETDEQKNERIAQEAAAKSAARAEKRAQSFQTRINELTAERKAAERRADDLLELVKSKGLVNDGKPAAQTGAPTREQFDSYEDFLRADARYVAQQEAKQLIETSTKAQQEAQARVSAERAAIEAQRSYSAREAELAKTVPDYHEVIEDSNVSLPQGVLNTILKMADGPAIAYQLAKQPDLAAQFWKDPNDAVSHGIILGQISATLKASPSKPSSAPPPGKGVGSKPAPSNGPPSDPKAYMAWAEKNMPKGRS